MLMNTYAFTPDEVNQLQINPYANHASFSTAFSTVDIPLRHIAAEKKWVYNTKGNAVFVNNEFLCLMTEMIS